MHIQNPPPNWPDVLPLLPDGAIIKAFDGSVLREAKQKWAALGRAPGKLTTCLRYFDMFYPFDRPYSAQEHAQIAAANFARFVDGTYLEQYASFVDLVETYNEHTDTRHASDPALLAPHLMAETAAVEVWNANYRGKLVPAHVRLVIVNSPVGNDIPKEFYQLAVASDSVLGTHPYTRWEFGVRNPGDFQFHSGRWAFNEAEYGLRPVYAFTECTPYGVGGQGWRAAGTLAGDEGLLVDAMRLWIRDVAQTSAYREGRILGPGCWFTCPPSGEWQDYKLETPQLVALAGMMGSEWRPGAPIPPGEDDMTDAQKAVIREVASNMRADADKLDALLAPVPLFRVKIIVNVLNIRSGPATTFSDVGDALIGQEFGVYEVAPSGWFRVDPAAQRWISGMPAYSTRI